MGFDINNVNIALKLTNNNSDAALAILSGEENQDTVDNMETETQQQLSEQDVMQLMQQNPEMFQQLLANMSTSTRNGRNDTKQSTSFYITSYSKS